MGGEGKRVRGADAYSPDQIRKFEAVLARQHNAPRVPPSVTHHRAGTDVGVKVPSDRVGPNVVSKYFFKKVVHQREKDFWNKPWGRKKVDLPLPSYLRDFKDADTYLLAPHFSHQRRNVGIASSAAASEAMMRSLSAPPIPGCPPESRIYGNHDVRNPARLPMMELPPRTPLENTVTMNTVASHDFMSKTHAATGTRGRRSGKMNPQKLNSFLDELTEAYALCSAHEQIAGEVVALKNRAQSQSGISLPPLSPSKGDHIGKLKTILSRTKIKR